jgi:hypothetical protein
LTRLVGSATLPEGYDDDEAAMAQNALNLPTQLKQEAETAERTFECLKSGSISMPIHRDDRSIVRFPTEGTT